MSRVAKQCSFCRAPIEEVTDLIESFSGEYAICGKCIKLSKKRLKEEGKLIKLFK